MTVPVSLSPVFTGQQFDNTGNMLANGMLYAYLAPSFSVLQTTYADSAGTVPNANPIILSSTGRLPSGLYLDNNKTYNFVLTASDGTTVIQQATNILPIALANFTGQKTISYATAGQAVFNLPFTYQAGSNVLSVYLNGAKLVVGIDYTETSASSFTLAKAATFNDVVEVDANAIITFASSSVNTQKQSFTAVAGQTLFNLSFTYTNGLNTLNVYMNGSKLLGGTDYIETSASSFTLTVAASAGDLFEVTTTGLSSLNTANSTSVSYLPSGTGAVTTTVSAKLGHTQNDVFDTGAVVDGVTDDAAKINQSLQNYPAVRLGAGTSITSGAAITGKLGSVIYGNPQDHITYTTVGASIIQSSQAKVFDFSVPGNANIQLCGVQIKPVSNLVASSKGINNLGLAYGEFEDLVITGFDTGIYNEKTQNHTYKNILCTANNIGMQFYSSGGTFNTGWFNNIIYLQNCSLTGNNTCNLDFQGDALRAVGCDISSIPTNSPYASVRVRANSYDASFDSMYFEQGAAAAPLGCVFLCEGGTTKISNSHITGGQSAPNAIGAMVKASGGAIVIIEGIRGFNYFTNLVTADGAGTIVYIMPGALQGSFVSVTKFVTTNGAKIIDLSNSIDQGTFVGTLTGCTTSPTLTINYQLVGNVVTLLLPSSLAATSNTTTCSITGLPAILTPTTNQWVNAVVADTGAAFAGQVTIRTTNDLYLTKTIDRGTTLFTNSGIKGIYGQVLTYTLN